MKNKLVTSLATVLFMIGMIGMAQAAPVSFNGKLSFVEIDTGGVYSGTSLGTDFSGVIDDEYFDGHITQGTILTNFGCCIAAGGLSIDNDIILVEEDANFLNSILGVSQYSAGDMVDGVNIEGDALTSSGGRIEIGLSYILDSNSFFNTDLSNYPFDPANVEVALFFIFEEDSTGTEVYSAGGPISSVPLPASIWLLGSGLIGLVRLKKKKTAVQLPLQS